MEEVVLLFELLKMDLELCVLLLLVQAGNFSYDIVEKTFIGDSLRLLGRDLLEYLLPARFKK